MWQLGGPDARGGLGADPASSLGFSVVAGSGDALWLAVGHVSGALSVWELQRRGPRQVAGIGARGCVCAVAGRRPPRSDHEQQQQGWEARVVLVLRCRPRVPSCLLLRHAACIAAVLHAAQHGARVTFSGFIPGRATSLLLSGDARCVRAAARACTANTQLGRPQQTLAPCARCNAIRSSQQTAFLRPARRTRLAPAACKRVHVVRRGRCCLHTFSSSLLRTAVTSRVLINGEYGPLLAISHLAPFSMPPPTLPAGASSTAPWPDEAAWSLLCEVGRCSALVRS